MSSPPAAGSSWLCRPPPTSARCAQSYGLLGVADDKADAVLASLPGWSLEALDTLVQPLHLAPEEVADLIAMGPNAFHGRHGVTVAASTDPRSEHPDSDAPFVI